MKRTETALLTCDGSSANWKTPKQLTQTAMARMNSLNEKCHVWLMVIGKELPFQKPSPKWYT